MGLTAKLTASANSLPWFPRPGTDYRHEQYDRVPCDVANLEYHGADTNSNNTDELTAIGEAITWISLQPPSTRASNEI